MISQYNRAPKPTAREIAVQIIVLSGGQPYCFDCPSLSDIGKEMRLSAGSTLLIEIRNGYDNDNAAVNCVEKIPIQVAVRVK